jgi:HEPN domain-containing protein
MKNKEIGSTQDWIIKAQNDLKAAEILYEENGPSDALCFHCHQSVEKFLKAFLIFKDIHFERIHHLWNLAKLCGKEDKEFLEFEEEFKTLHAYYIELRYPSDVAFYPREECKKVLDMAGKLTQFIIRKII